MASWSVKERGKDSKEWKMSRSGDYLKHGGPVFHGLPPPFDKRRWFLCEGSWGESPSVGARWGNNKGPRTMGFIFQACRNQGHTYTGMTLGRKPKQLYLSVSGEVVARELGVRGLAFSFCISIYLCHVFVCSSKRPCTFSGSFNPSGHLLRKPS